MCVILYKPLNVKLDYHDLDQMWSRNNDGAGLAYFVRKDGFDDLQVQVEKGFMKLRQLKTRLDELFDKWGDIQIAIHFRNATSGGVCEEFTHPFAIDKDPDVAMAVLEETYPAVVMHNGVIPKMGSKDCSDTLEFVTTVLAYVEPVARPKFLNMIDGKFLLMQNNTFHFCGNWEEWAGLKVTNSYWKWAQHVTVYPGYEEVRAGKKSKCGFQSSYSDIYSEEEVIELDAVKEITKDGEIITTPTAEGEIISQGEVITDPIAVREELEKEKWRRYYDD